MMEPAGPEFDRYAKCYEEALRESIPDVFAEDAAYFAEYKVRHLARRMHDDNLLWILDFGCGVGLSLDFLSQQFPKAELWGFDVSEESLRIARQRNKHANLTSNLEDLPQNAFGLILAANVFHHIPLEARFTTIEHCKRLLKANGRLFLFEHNPINPLTRLIFERCPYDQDAKMLTRKEALELASAANFSVVKSDYTLFFPRQLLRLRFLEKFMGWLPLGAQYCVEMIK